MLLCMHDCKYEGLLLIQTPISYNLNGNQGTTTRQNETRAHIELEGVKRMQKDEINLLYDGINYLKKKRKKRAQVTKLRGRK